MKRILQAATSTCTAMIGIPLDQHTACVFAGCVIAQVEFANPMCAACACEWIAGNRPREESQCSYCDSCEADYHICENDLTFNATVPFPNMIAY